MTSNLWRIYEILRQNRSLKLMSLTRILVHIFQRISFCLRKLDVIMFLSYKNRDTIFLQTGYFEILTNCADFSPFPKFFDKYVLGSLILTAGRHKILQRIFFNFNGNLDNYITY